MDGGRFGVTVRGTYLRCKNFVTEVSSHVTLSIIIFSCENKTYGKMLLSVELVSTFILSVYMKIRRAYFAHQFSLKRPFLSVQNVKPWSRPQD